ncbi:MAG TPA: NADH-quinone oxidoreductase subunit A [Acidobacteriota bacterium]|nr:NADH-quinone oxidoreductase subunit A [Acidobacteriota bacterium]HRV08414.1 NADH-quinone oxidoreductase subunit A [Acidobacteriota bacterium]
MEQYFGLALMAVAAATTAAGMLALHRWLGPRISNRVHDMPFECGNDPARIVRGRFGVKFFLVALLFVLFDIELIFLFPWAVIYRELGWFGFAEMAVFLSVVVVGLVYSVRRGALEWR